MERLYRRPPGAYGSVVNRTPRIDEIGEVGVRFDRCYATNSLCSPSRASILTGTYSHLNGVMTLVTPIDASQPTFITQLKEAGLRVRDGRQVAHGRRAWPRPAGLRPYVGQSLWGRVPDAQGVMGALTHGARVGALDAVRACRQPRQDVGAVGAVDGLEVTAVSGSLGSPFSPVTCPVNAASDATCPSYGHRRCS
ncbi:MAG TPA: sulfatase-like hydrolase/transferase [Propionibacteriaceae bacterium]|nr:sulfatase-like hydrolase/transferase [Propionibacteriaceae bacterium]